MQLHEELIALLTALAEDRVDYAIVGGIAVAIWGAPRATKDIDLLVQPGDIGRAKATARRCGFTLSAEPMEFADGMTVHRVSKVGEGHLLMLDLLVVNKNLQGYWDRRESRALEGTQVWVISRDGLIAMKVAAGRPQDQADVIRLLEMDR